MEQSRQVTLLDERKPAMTAAAIEAPGMKIQFLIEGSATSDSVSIFRCDFEAGARSPMPHAVIAHPPLEPRPLRDRAPAHVAV
jgi:hypothetical protein